MLVVALVTASGAWLLLAAGVMKLARPQGTSAAVRNLTKGLLPATPTARLLGFVEGVIASWYLVSPSREGAMVLGLWFGALLLTAAALRTRGVDCGCFGAMETPVTTAHIVVASVVAVASLLASIAGDAEIASRAIGVAAIPMAIGTYGAMVPLPALRKALTEGAA